MGLKFSRDTFLKWIAIILITAGCVGALHVFIKTDVKPPELKVLAAFLKKMESRGYKKKPSQGLEEFALKHDDKRYEQRFFILYHPFKAFITGTYPFNLQSSLL